MRLPSAVVPRLLRGLCSLVVLLAAACSSAPDAVTGPIAASGAAPSVALASIPTAAELPAACASEATAQAAINDLLPQLFKPGAGKRGRAQGFNNTIEKARREGELLLARSTIDEFINFTLTGYFGGDLIGGQSNETRARVLSLFYLLYCSNSITPVPDLSGIFQSSNTVFIRPTTADTVVRDNPADTKAAILVRTGDVPDNLFGTFVSVVPTTTALPTDLDWYGLTGLKSGAFEFSATPAVIFDTPVRTGVCIDYDETVVTSADDLRLAHGIDPANPPPAIPGNVIFGSIEILAPQPVTALGLDCDGLPVPLAGTMGRVLNTFATLFLPSELHAAAALLGGTRGGDIRSLSPFAVVDTRLVATGNGPTSPIFIPVGSTSTTAPATVTISTRNVGTPIAGIHVSFAPSASFAPSTVTTGTNGTAATIWTLVAGTNSGSGSASGEPFSFVGSPAAFSATAVQVEPVIVATSPAPPSGTATVPYAPFTFSAGGGVGTFTWTVSAGALPSGLSLSPTGTLGGTPTTAGSFSFTVRAASGPEGAATSGTAAFTIAVATPPVSITTTTLPAAQRGIAYSASLAATGGTGNYVWTVTAGALPDGLAITGDLITGTPTAVATSSSFTVQATSGTQSDARALNIAVGAPAAITLVFDPGPSTSVCYAQDGVLTPLIGVSVRDQAGRPLAGVRVSIRAETNNGSNVAVSQPFATSDASGRAVFTTLSINKTGGYRLVATTGTPWPEATRTSGRFGISPSC